MALNNHIPLVAVLIHIAILCDDRVQKICTAISAATLNGQAGTQYAMPRRAAKQTADGRTTACPHTNQMPSNKMTEHIDGTLRAAERTALVDCVATAG